MNIFGSAKTWRRAAAGFAVSALLLTACDSTESSSNIWGSGAEEDATATETPEPEASDPNDAETGDAETGTDTEGTEQEDEPGTATDGEVDSGAQVAPSESFTESAAGDVTVTDRGVLIGNPDAQFQIQVFADPRCPFCAQLSQLMAQSEQEWAQGDEVAVEHVTLTFLDDELRAGFSARAGNILAAIADQSPADWRIASGTIFEIQPESREADVTDAQIFAALEQAGIEITDEIRSAASEMRFDAWNVSMNGWAAAEMGVVGVPSVFLNGSRVEGYDNFEELIEMLNDAVVSD